MISVAALRSALILAGALLRVGRAPPLELHERLAMVPLEAAPVGQPVDLCWSDRQLPFVAARSDRDLAVGLGVVHAHLRRAQMEILRRVSQGRAAEMVGPAGIVLDRAVRGLDIGRAVPAIERMLPPGTRDWVEGFVAGVNHYAASARVAPLECRVLAIEPEPWTVADVLRLGRLFSADVNWPLLFRMLGLRRGPEWAGCWQELLRHGTGASAAEPEDALAQLAAMSRSGSNAWAVGPARSRSGAPVLGGDPHLPITVPNVWIAVACRSPGLHFCGLMLPGLPVAAIGRSPALARGGTNLHAASTDIFALPEGALEVASARRETVAVRGARPVTFTFRETPYGPVLGDAVPMEGPPHAFRWVGHDATDEMTALLRLNAARSLDEAMEATAGLAIPGQNFLLASREGRIAKVTAAHLPRRTQDALAEPVMPPAALSAWDGLASGDELPREVDPARGFVVSANDRPRASPVPIGLFFSPPDRAERLAGLLRSRPALGLDDAVALQTDVLVTGALPLRDLLLERIGALPPRPARQAALLGAMRGWDGSYDAASAGALAFELVIGQLVRLLHSPARRAAYGAVWSGRTLLLESFAACPPETFAQALQRALRRAAGPFRAHGRWGALHRLRLQHPFGALPLLGRRFRAADLPAAGTTDSVMKTAHGPVTGRHAAAYGSMARYAFDLANPDANRLTLLGGQDGWWGSDTALDQIALWERGEGVEVPLSEAGAARVFRHRTTLRPR
ncbi:penicillin acylase family protein [Pararoseomonas indoligenes]|uniref:Penicillin acylase family protein n=1 Tax=Roseomonas indoligenes TaxID=2820811 RepID=A0A940N1G5_9PROT|nr:penicillin acylase family protein [Pararoseomonas indoligenes]MBP0494985.1 penicillin acylase family protein [Pararoseomonas indoligenes]